MNNKVIILQNTVPHYRKEFFEKVRQRLLLENVALELLSCSQFNFFTTWSYFKKIFDTRDTLVVPFSIREHKIYVFLLLKLTYLIFRKEKMCRVIWWGIGHMPSERLWIKIYRIALMAHVEGVILYTEKERYLYSILSKGRLKPFSFCNCVNSEPQGSLNKTRGSRIGFIGTLHERSRADLLPDIIKLCLENDPELSFEIVGNGPLLPKLKRVLEKYDQISFIGEVTDPKDVSEILKHWKLGIYPGAVGLSSYTYLKNTVPYVAYDEAFVQSPEHAELPADIKISPKGRNAMAFASEILHSYYDNKRLDKISSDMMVVRDFYTSDRSASKFVAALKKVELY